MNNAFSLTHERIFDHYGFTIPLSGARLDVDFENLLPAGRAFENGKAEQRRSHNALDFSLQANYVNFYQVSGNNPVETLRSGAKHKFQTVGQIETDKLVNGTGMQVRADGMVKCVVWNRLESKPLRSENTTVQISLAGENEPHYTWLLT